MNRYTEHIIELSEPLVVRGSVVAADTGRPVAKFRVIPGYGYDSLAGGIKTDWMRGDMSEFVDGRFTFRFTYPRESHRLRIEATGYLPAESQHIKASDGTQELEFRLVKGANVQGIVVCPDGSPAHDADVVLATRDRREDISNGRLMNPRDVGAIRTDSNGAFFFTPLPDDYVLVALHDSGYAEVTSRNVAGVSEIHLAPWGRLEGTLRIGDQPGSGELVGFSRSGTANSITPVDDQYRVQTNPEGRYVFERVIPGAGTVGRELMIRHADKTFSFRRTGHTDVEIAAGETKSLDIGGLGRPVVGRIVVPPITDAPFDFSQDPVGLIERIDIEKSRSSYFRVDSDGSFRADDVPSGEYRLSVRLYTPGRAGEAIGAAGREFIIPDMPGGRSDEPLDLGEIDAAIYQSLEIGDSVPTVEGTTIDGQRFSLDAHRGHFVLMDFWATWCGPCRAEFPFLKEIRQAYAQDNRLVMVGLSLDARAEAAARFAKDNGLDWTQVHLGEWSTTAVPYRFGVRGIPAIFLISPDGKVIAKNLRGQQIKAALQSALDHP